MKIEKLSGGLWVPSADAQIEQWREKGHPHMQESCVNQFTKWCENQNKSFNKIVDVGAWCGTFALKMQQFAKQINCYEPSKLHFECLSRNVAPHSHIKLYNQAIGNMDGFIKLTQESSTQNTRVLLEKGDTKISKLDSLDLDGVDMLKIDVEGLEAQVLQGAENTLKDVKYIMIELNKNSERYGSSNGEIESQIKTLGFKKIFKVWPDKVYYRP